MREQRDFTVRGAFCLYATAQGQNAPDQMRNLASFVSASSQKPIA